MIALTLELMICWRSFFAGVVGRVALRRPWLVLARTEDADYRWPVSGWRASGERVNAVADAVARGGIPPGAQVVRRDDIALEQRHEIGAAASTR